MFFLCLDIKFKIAIIGSFLSHNIFLESHQKLFHLYLKLKELKAS